MGPQIYKELWAPWGIEALIFCGLLVKNGAILRRTRT